jgi:hypothetical protein
MAKILTFQVIVYGSTFVFIKINSLCKLEKLISTICARERLNVNNVSFRVKSTGHIIKSFETPEGLYLQDNEVILVQ